MPEDSNRPVAVALARTRGLEVAVVAAAMVVFAIDIRMPIGLTFWILHLIPLGAVMFTWRPRLPLIVAALVTLFVVVDYFLSPAGTSPLMSQINRGIGIATFWSIGWAGHRHIIAKIELAKEQWIRRVRADNRREERQCGQ